MFEYNFGDSEIKFILFYFFSLPFLNLKGDEHVQTEDESLRSVPVSPGKRSWSTGTSSWTAIFSARSSAFRRKPRCRWSRSAREELRLGGAGNVAANIDQLGAARPAAGRRRQRRLSPPRSAGIKKDRQSGDPAMPQNQTIVKTRIISQRQQIVRVDREAQIRLERGAAGAHPGRDRRRRGSTASSFPITPRARSTPR